MVSTSPPFCSLYQTGAPMNFSDCSFNYLLSNPKNCELIRRLACYCTMYDLHYCVAHSAYPFFYKYSFTDPTFVNLTNEIILEDIFSNFIKIFTILQTILNYHSRIFDESSVWGLIYSFNFYLSSQISKFSQANYILNSILQTSHFPIAVDRLVTLTKNQQSLFDSYYSKVSCSGFNLIEIFCILFRYEESPSSLNLTMIENAFLLKINNLFVTYPLDITWKLILELIKIKNVNIRQQNLKSLETFLPFLHSSCNQIEPHNINNLFAIHEYISHLVIEHVRNTLLCSRILINTLEFNFYFLDVSHYFQNCLPRRTLFIHLRLFNITDVGIIENAILSNNCNLYYKDYSSAYISKMLCKSQDFAKNIQKIHNQCFTIVLLIHQNTKIIQYISFCEFKLANTFIGIFSNYTGNHPRYSIYLQYFLQLLNKINIHSLKPFSMNSNKGKELYPRFKNEIHDNIRFFFSNFDIFDHSKNIILSYCLSLSLKEKNFIELSTICSFYLGYYCIGKFKSSRLPLQDQILYSGLHLSKISDSMCLLTNKNILLFFAPDGLFYF